MFWSPWIGVSGDVRYKKLTDFWYGIYASGSYFGSRQRPGCVDDLAHETWCGYVSELLFTSELEVLPDEIAAFTSRYRSTNVSVQLAAALSGHALAALPYFVASLHPTLERILQPEVSVQRTFWLAVHEDMAKYPRVRAVMDALEGLVARDRAIFTPSASSPSPIRQRVPGPLIDVANDQGSAGVVSRCPSVVDGIGCANIGIRA